MFLIPDLASTWWKMIDISQLLQFGISLKFFKFRFSQDMVKDDWPLPVTAVWNLTYNFLSSDLARTWWKMIDPHPPRCYRPEYYLEFLG